MNILFVLKHRGNAGSTHAVANYIRLAPEYGHSAAIFGTPVWYLPELKFSMDIGEFDRIVYLFESELFEPVPFHQAILLDNFPRAHRLIIDTDGMYNELIHLNRYDYNHASEEDRVRWLAYMDTLGDKIVQTLVHKPTHPRVIALPFFGYDPALEIDQASAPPKNWDVLYVGHNWWRWREVSQDILPALSEIRDEIGDVGFLGLWWDQPPAEGPDAGPAEAFHSDPYAFKSLRIKTPKAVMYNDVIKTMSTSKVNIFTQRPLLRHLKHLTLKYFEVFCADTIPLLMLSDEHAAEVYGPAARELTLPGRAARRMREAIRNPGRYQGIVEDIRAHLRANHSYDTRARELFEVLAT